MAAMDAELATAFRDSLCMSIRSYRRDGTPVDTPMWTVPLDGRLYCYTDERTHKVKRLSHRADVMVAACDQWGLRSTDWFPGRCTFVTDPGDRTRVFEALERKYGIHYRMSLWGSRLVNRVKHRLVLAFELVP